MAQKNNTFKYRGFHSGTQRNFCYAGTVISTDGMVGADAG